MTAKEYLKQAFFLDRKIKAKERQLESLRAHAQYVSPQFTLEVKGSPSLKSALEESAVKIMELEEYISNQIQELVKLRKEIAETIKAINNSEYEAILEMRYLSFMPWNEIAARLGYGSNYIFEVHGRALQLIHITE